MGDQAGYNSFQKGKPPLAREGERFFDIQDWDAKLIGEKR